MVKLLGRFEQADGKFVDVFESGAVYKSTGLPVVDASCGTKFLGRLSINPEVLVTGPEPGEYFIKTWSENAALSKAVLASGIFVDTGKRIPSGFVEIQIWKLNSTK